MILDYYLIFDTNGMKKDINNHHHQQYHQYHNNHQTQNIQICTNATNRTTSKLLLNTTSPILITKNVRSSSLPLKILNNTSNRLQQNSLNNNNTTNRSNHVIQSWTDFSFLNKPKNNFDCFNLNGLYFNYKYREISRSERFLDFIEFREQSDNEFKSNSSSSISTSSSSPSIFGSDFNNNNRNKLEEDDETDSNSSLASASEDLSQSLPKTTAALNTTIVNISNESNTIETVESNKNLDESANG